MIQNSQHFQLTAWIHSGPVLATAYLIEVILNIIKEYSMQSLNFVANAISHAESLADEASDLMRQDLAEDLWKRSRSMSRSLDDAIQAVDMIKPARQKRDHALDKLRNTYANTTCLLQVSLEAKDVHRFCPGSNLNMAERVRYRLRQIEEQKSECAPSWSVLNQVRADLNEALKAYEQTVDLSLMALGQAQSAKSVAVFRSQQLRIFLEKAKYELLKAAEPKSPAWRRIKKRTVRTKRAQWLDGMRYSKANPLSALSDS
jgi:hypothetical protein